MHKNGDTTDALPARKSANHRSTSARGSEMRGPIPEEYLEKAMQLLASATARRLFAENVIKSLAA